MQNNISKRERTLKNKKKLTHYKQKDPNKLKYETVRSLIENMAKAKVIFIQKYFFYPRLLFIK